MKRLLSILLLILLILPQVAWAAPDGLDWPYYTDEEHDNTEQLNEGTGGAGASTNTPEGCNGAQTVYNFLSAQQEGGQDAFTPEQIAGILGNFDVESNFSPTIENPNSGAYGLAQWLGGRLANLRTKPNYNTLDAQLDFLWEELHGDESRAYERIRGAGGTGISGARNAATIWEDAFERSGGAALPQRRADAEKWYNAISSGNWDCGGENS